MNEEEIYIWISGWDFLSSYIKLPDQSFALTLSCPVVFTFKSSTAPPGQDSNKNRSDNQLSLAVNHANDHNTDPSKYPQRCRFYTRPLQPLSPPPPDTRALACAHSSASVTSFVSIFKCPSQHRTTFDRDDLGKRMCTHGRDRVQYGIIDSPDESGNMFACDQPKCQPL
jgi:hypothetical protein